MKELDRRKPSVALWLCAAILVTVLRFLHAGGPGYDLGIQIRAAHNLLAGSGLSVYRHAGLDLTDPASLVTLTYFPSGYSLLAAALIAVGLSVGTAIKVPGAVATLLGWWGWGRLAHPFLIEGLNRGSVWKWVGFAIPTFTPLLFTPWWAGTDIFLWAAVPWVVDYVVRASDEKVPGRWRLDALAGALCGLAILMRYASFLLAVYAAFVILWQCQLRIRVLARRWSAFGVGLLPALALQGYVVYFLSNSPVRLGGVSFNATQVGVVQRLWEGIPTLRTANYLWAFWVPGQAARLLFSNAPGLIPWQLGITLVAFVSLALAVKTYGIGLAAASRDPRIVASGLFVAVPLMLLGCMMLSPTNYLGDQRYYLPVVPLSVLVAYSIASIASIPPRRSVIGFLRTFCVLFVTGYIVMSLVYVLFLFVPGRIGTSQREKVMASELHRWPSMKVSHEFSSARQFVMRRLKEQPYALLLTSRAHLFFWDPAVDGSRVHELNCRRLRATYLSGPARVLIYTFDNGQPQELWYYRGNATSGYQRRAHCFERFSDLHVLQRFPEEGVKVLEARIGAGQHIFLKP